MPKDFKNTLKVKELKENFNVERLDPKYYFLGQTLDHELSKCTYKLDFLRNIVSAPIVSGTRPGGRAKYTIGEVPSLEGGNISEDGRIDLVDLKHVPHTFHQKHSRSAVKPLDILMVKDGATTGKVAIIPPDFPYKECNINEHLFRIRIKEEYNPYFVYAFLFSSLGQMQVERESSGGAQKGIVKRSVENFVIPIPPQEIRIAIAEEMKKVFAEVESLREKTNVTVRDAQTKITEMLTGPT